MTIKRNTWLKVLGLACILIATSGFGFHNWSLTNRVNDADARITKLMTERELYVDAYTRFRQTELRKLIHEVTLNIGHLFSKIDRKLLKQIRPKTEEGIDTSEENMRKAQRRGFLELAIAATDTTEKADYASAIAERFDKSKTVEERDAIKQEIVAKLDSQIQRVQAERDELRARRQALVKERDGFYLFYLCIQVLGIILTLSSEIPERKAVGKPIPPEPVGRGEEKAP